MRLAITGFYVSLALFMSQAHASDEITWLSGEFEGTPNSRAITPGSSDTSLSRLMSKMPNFTHRVVGAGVKRSMLMLEHEEHACHTSLLHTQEREKVAVFFDVGLLPQLQAVVRRETLAQLPRNDLGDLDLARALKMPEFKVLLVSGRSYGSWLDGVLEKAGTASITYLPQGNLGTRLLAMVGGKRADLTIEYEFAFKAAKASANGLPDLVVVPIQGASELMRVGIACPKNEWGKAVIRQVATHMRTAESAAMLKRELLSVLTPENRARYASQIDAFYAEMQRAPDASAASEALSQRP